MWRVAWTASYTQCQWNDDSQRTRRTMRFCRTIPRRNRQTWTAPIPRIRTRICRRVGRNTRVDIGVELRQIDIKKELVSNNRDNCFNRFLYYDTQKNFGKSTFWICYILDLLLLLPYSLLWSVDLFTTSYCFTILRFLSYSFNCNNSCNALGIYHLEKLCQIY